MSGLSSRRNSSGRRNSVLKSNLLNRLDSRNYPLPWAANEKSTVIEQQEELVKKLNTYYIQLKTHILQHQSPTLGLFPEIGNEENPTHIAHVRASIYSAVAVWSLSQAYRKVDDDQGRTHELAQSAVKCMRGILFCWIRQADKVESFKANQRAEYALHSAFHMVTGDPVYRDDEYGHLQINVIGLYLIFLVQMISSGLQIIFTTDEVNFVQNLVFYVERAYRTPDYGTWERGSKYNNGSTEIHASSIGIAKAALEAVNGENLFGKQGASWSVIFVDYDAHNRNRTIFEGILPRESNSKNTDAALISTIGWPTFALHEEDVKKRTFAKVLRKLKGKYGIKRFLRDGYRTVLEDSKRRFYKPAEIKLFDGIECEWPVFYIYLMIDRIFHHDKEGIKYYSKLLEPLLYDSDGGKLVPKFYYVPKENIEEEKRNPGSMTRYPSAEGSTDGTYMLGQSIYFISQLLVHGLLNLNDLDPIRRHLPASERPKVNMRYSSFQITPPDLVTQVILIAESSRLQQLLATYGIQTQTPHQIEPIQIWSPKELSKAYEYLGVNKKLGLTGRPKRPFGVLSTSKIYRVCGSTVLCYPLVFEVSDFYLAQDIPIMLDDLKNDLAFLSKCWKLSGRPTFCMIIRESNVRGPSFSEFLDLLAQFKRGDVDGVRVRMGKLQSLITSGCVEHLDFLDKIGDPTDVFVPFEEKTVGTSFKSLTEIPNLPELNDAMLRFNEEDLARKPNWDLINMLKSTDGIISQSQILKVLFQREGAHFWIEGESITQKMERLIHQAGLYKEWSAVRLQSALLRKTVDSLAPSVTTILVRGKQVTVGIYGHEEEVLDKPVSPGYLQDLIFKICLPHNIQEAVLQQELILGIGKLIATAPDLFEGILKIRIGWFVRAMRFELEQDEEGVELHDLSPNDVKAILIAVLVRNVYDADLRTPLQKRQLDGALNRVPKDFYDRVWSILEKTPYGIKVAGYLLPQQPTLSDMTMYELNFSLLVEQMLSKIVDPAYRQIMVETFMVVSTMLDRNPEATFDQAVNMDRMISDAFEAFQRDLNKSEGHEKQDDMTKFFNTPPHVKQGTSRYLTKAVINSLLDGEMKVESEDMCLLA
ncbi:phosphorylase b kinase regulatory subunit beta-like isoform X2 [Ostrea edulis]|uniref:phosphorylase b kinase regulatory subunit beta-like isoform X2 n=1 Tax=Ostrea edulis TaxID=37623 RepID=UPI0024AFD94C|nr:phosphorylase b kinase regulatory subunit beta-like isoform X2 [Ostrea edulis]